MVDERLDAERQQRLQQQREADGLRTELLLTKQLLEEQKRQAADALVQTQQKLQDQAQRNEQEAQRLRDELDSVRRTVATGKRERGRERVSVHVLETSETDTDTHHSGRSVVDHSWCRCAGVDSRRSQQTSQPGR